MEQRDKVVEQKELSHLDESKIEVAKNMLLEEANSFSVNDCDIGCGEDLILDLRSKGDTPV